MSKDQVLNVSWFAHTDTFYWGLFPLSGEVIFFAQICTFRREAWGTMEQEPTFSRTSQISRSTESTFIIKGEADVSSRTFLSGIATRVNFHRTKCAKCAIFLQHAVSIGILWSVLKYSVCVYVSMCVLILWVLWECFFLGKKIPELR